jgi:hypothetical protein
MENLLEKTKSLRKINRHASRVSHSLDFGGGDGEDQCAPKKE